MAQFKCPHCGEIKYIPRFRTTYKDGKTINTDLDTKKEICCDNCKISMKFIPEKGNFTSTYSQFSTLSPLEKQKLLRKRSDEDAKKKKYRQQDFEKDHYNA